MNYCRLNKKCSSKKQRQVIEIYLIHKIHAQKSLSTAMGRILRLFQIFLDVFLETVIVEFVTIRISRGTPSNGVPRFRYYQLSKPFFIVLLQEGMIIVSGRSLLSGSYS